MMMSGSYLVRIPLEEKFTLQSSQNDVNPEQERNNFPSLSPLCHNTCWSLTYCRVAYDAQLLLNGVLFLWVLDSHMDSL